MERRKFCKLFIPGFGPVVDSLETRSLNPLDWSKDTKAGLALHTSALTLSSCQAKPTAKEPTATSEKQLSLSIEFPELVRYYSEIANFPVFESGAFSSKMGLNQWVNLTPRKVNQEALAKIYSFFEGLGQEQLRVNYKLGQEEIPFTFLERPPREKVIFIIPSEAPKPGWGPAVSFEAASTSKFPDKYISFIRLASSQDIPTYRLFETIEEITQYHFQVEACQASIVMGSDSVEQANLGQEILCNSFGAAAAAHDAGVSQKRYFNWAETTTIGPNPQIQFPVYKVDNYLEIPRSGLVLK